MRRSLALPLVVLIGAASAATIAVAAAATETPTVASDAVAADERYGIVHYDKAARTWAILSTSTFQSSGLNRVSCAPDTGVLTVEFTPLAFIGTFSVDEDDAYAGRYAAGAKATKRSLAITFHQVGSGEVVPCDAAELRIANSSLQLAVRGNGRPEPTPPTPPTGEPSDPGPSDPGPSDPSPSDGRPTPPPTSTSTPSAG